jgi:hypothetical protein
MPRKTRGGARRAWTTEQRWELAFAWGGQHAGCIIEVGEWTPCDGIGCWSAFTDEADRELAWWQLRDELLDGRNPGVRPPGFWVYEAPGLCRCVPRCQKWPKDQAAWLEKHGQLTMREKAALSAQANTIIPIGEVLNDNSD